MKIKTKDYEIELTIWELKELLIKDIHKNPSSISSSKKPTVEPLKLTKSNLDSIKLEKIRQIKDLAKNGHSNKEIALRLGISPQLSNYWRKNTPKDLGE
jgi:DNA-binding NarL/FixJ family response regulator